MKRKWERDGRFYQTDKSVEGLATKEREFDEETLPTFLTVARLDTLPR